MKKSTKDLLEKSLATIVFEIDAADERLRELTELDEERGSLDHLRSALREALEVDPSKEKR